MRTKAVVGLGDSGSSKQPSSANKSKLISQLSTCLELIKLGSIAGSIVERGSGDLFRDDDSDSRRGVTGGVLCCRRETPAYSRSFNALGYARSRLSLKTSVS